MSFWQRVDWPRAMASRWRRRRICELLADGRSSKAALLDISGSEARVDTDLAPALGSEVELHHPYAGSITGRVSDIYTGGIRIRLDRQEHAVAFALGAIAADMTLD
jgi:hypothetical protein